MAKPCWWYLCPRRMPARNRCTWWRRVCRKGPFAVSARRTSAVWMTTCGCCAAPANPRSGRTWCRLPMPAWPTSTRKPLPNTGACAPWRTRKPKSWLTTTMKCWRPCLPCGAWELICSQPWRGWCCLANRWPCVDCSLHCASTMCVWWAPSGWATRNSVFSRWTSANP